MALPAPAARPHARGGKRGGAVNGFVALTRGDVVLELIRANSDAFLLLTQIAVRARWKEGFNAHGLGVGEAFIGDYKAIGLTRQKYRTAQVFLAKHGFSTFKPTNKGTIAKVTDSRVFDITLDNSNQQTNHQLTIKQPSANHQLTTNEDRVDRVDREDREDSFHQFWAAYPRKVGKADARKAFQKHQCSGLIEVILASIEEHKRSADWTKDRGDFIPHPTTFINGHRWEDDLTPMAPPEIDHTEF